MQWAAVDTAISKEGWKLITLLRLSPIIPWNILNYAVSVTGGLRLVATNCFGRCRIFCRIAILSGQSQANQL